MDENTSEASGTEDEPRDIAREHLRNIWRREAVELSAAPSWGERLLPLIFAAMETCWVDGILIALAGANVFHLHEPLLPLWTPLLLMAGSAWLVSYLERRELAAGDAHPSDGKRKATAGSSLFIWLLTIVALVSIWSSIYASSAWLVDPRWLLTMLSDLLLLAPRAYHVLGIIALSVYFCWRGLALARRVIEPGAVLNRLRIGVGVFVLVIVVRAGAGDQFYGELPLLFLLPCFVALALIAHALAKAIFVRQVHPVGLLGNIAVQEGAVLMVVGTIGVILLLFALLLGTFASPAFLVQVHLALAPVGIVYNWFVTILAQFTVLLLTPVFWLISLLPVRQQQPVLPRSSPVVHGVPKQTTPPEALLIAATVFKVVLPLLVIVGLAFLAWRLLRRRRVVLRRRDQDLHESVWSWRLFRGQLQGLLRALWLRFFGHKSQAEEAQPVAVEITGEPAARTVREIYRALLRWAAGCGYPRAKDETPYEFQQRLQEKLPQSMPELGMITDAYALVRYGESVPDEREVEHVQGEWQALQRKEQALPER
ncbi:DUF4129 domain-containing protein [Reticulibacter mediterranei]|uniref:DUF4129 domain-containing protein n=1 Tax=Reticulibacter mediterranei TaxID=2778369 RepID=UPI001C6901FA|nr:DUF4129 domain-containing protein [Reticulibacter mediterranei]